MHRGSGIEYPIRETVHLPLRWLDHNLSNILLLETMSTGDVVEFKTNEIVVGLEDLAPRRVEAGNTRGRVAISMFRRLVRCL